MSELVITSNRGSGKLTVQNDGSGDYYVAQLEGESVHGARRFYLHGQTGLDSFFADLAAQWRGWSGEHRWSSLEGDVSIDASHDGLGTVSLVVTIRGEHLLRMRQPAVPDWEATVVLEVDAGALDQLAREATHVR